jgi:hypothetical protein
MNILVHILKIVVKRSSQQGSCGMSILRDVGDRDLCNVGDRDLCKICMGGDLMLD